MKVEERKSIRAIKPPKESPKKREKKEIITVSVEDKDKEKVDSLLYNSQS